MNLLSKYFAVILSLTILAFASDEEPRSKFAELMAGSRGDVYLGEIENFKELEDRLDKSDTDIKFVTKKEPELDQAFFIAKFKIEENLTNKYNIDFIDVAIPAVKIKGNWQLLFGVKTLRSKSYLLIDRITLGGQTIYALNLSVPYSDKFKKSLKEEIDLATKAGTRR